MNSISLRKQSLIILSILALIMVMCGGGASEEEATEEVVEEVETLESPAVTTAKSLGAGVTEEPCPEVIGNIPTNADQEKGCIYLGILSDYTGPYGAAGLPVEIGIRSYWAWKNQTGCLKNYCVAVKEAADTGYNPQKHLEEYNAMKDDIAALALSLGTPLTLFILDELDKDNMIAAPLSWYSGWSFDSVDKGLIIEYGSTYCADGMNGLDWSVDNLPVDIKKIGIVAQQDDYGLDYAAGVKTAAAARGVEVAWEYLYAPGQFDVTQAVGLLVTQPVDAYFPAVDPGSMAQMAGGAAQNGVVPITIMATPSYSGQFVVEGSPVKGLFESGAFFASSVFAPYGGETPGHENMRNILAAYGVESTSVYIVAGWASQQHISSALSVAVRGDLTREGIRSAAANVPVSSDGMFPSKTLGANVQTPVSVITTPNGSEPGGTTILQEGYTGPTGEGYDWSGGPCS
tara:strand:- start:21670 stop:23046 length:1377 start_codon:yes stop_codon:yes gene_type:complete